MNLSKSFDFFKRIKFCKERKNSQFHPCGFKPVHLCHWLGAWLMWQIPYMEGDFAVWDLFHFSSSLWASTSEAFAGIPLSLIMRDWNLVCRTMRLTNESPCEWLPPFVCFVKLNFDGCSLGNPRQLGIGGLIRMFRAFSKPAG